MHLSNRTSICGHNTKLVNKRQAIDVKSFDFWEFHPFLNLNIRASVFKQLTLCWRRVCENKHCALGQNILYFCKNSTHPTTSRWRNRTTKWQSGTFSTAVSTHRVRQWNERLYVGRRLRRNWESQPSLESESNYRFILSSDISVSSILSQSYLFFVAVFFHKRNIFRRCERRCSIYWAAVVRRIIRYATNAQTASSCWWTSNWGSRRANGRITTST